MEQPILDEPEFHLIFDADAGLFGVRLRVDPGRSVSRAGRLRNIVIRRVLIAGNSYVEVVASSHDLFRAVYALASDVLARVGDGEADYLLALEASLSNFESLVARTSGLSRERALGLYGELSVLHSLLTENAVGVNSWTGPSMDAHDFRLGELDLEVKTTTANVRKHVIHGLNQLSPLPGRPLFLVSLRLTGSFDGGGVSVNSLVAAIDGLLNDKASALQRFHEALDEYGYDSSNSECQTCYRHAAPVMAVPVATDVPALSYSWLATVLGGSAASRISDVSLTLNLEGLGVPFDPNDYPKVLV